MSEGGSEVSNATRGWGRAGFWFGFLHILIHKCTSGAGSMSAWNGPGPGAELENLFLSTPFFFLFCCTCSIANMTDTATQIALEP